MTVSLPQIRNIISALANLLYYEFLTSYQPYFPANSDFWSYFKTTHEWSEGVIHETQDDYFKHNLSWLPTP